MNVGDFVRVLPPHNLQWSYGRISKYNAQRECPYWVHIFRNQGRAYGFFKDELELVDPDLVTVMLVMES